MLTTSGSCLGVGFYMIWGSAQIPTDLIGQCHSDPKEILKRLKTMTRVKLRTTIKFETLEVLNIFLIVQYVFSSIGLLVSF